MISLLTVREISANVTRGGKEAGITERASTDHLGWSIVQHPAAAGFPAAGSPPRSCRWAVRMVVVRSQAEVNPPVTQQIGAVGLIGSGIGVLDISPLRLPRRPRRR